MKIFFSWILFSILGFSSQVLAQSSTAKTRACDLQIDEASSLFGHRQFIQAAQQFEQAWQECQQLRALSGAAQARLSAGHYAHAIRYFHQFLEAGKSIADITKSETQKRIEQARENTVQVKINIRVDNEQTGAFRITLQHIPDAAHDQRPELILEQTSREFAIDLDPDLWQIMVFMDGYDERMETIVLDPQVPSSVVTIQLISPRQYEALAQKPAQQSPASPSTPFHGKVKPAPFSSSDTQKIEIPLTTRRWIAGSFGAVSAASITGGIFLAVDGDRFFGQVLEDNKDCVIQSIRCNEENLIRGIRLKRGGLGLIGFGIGLLAPAITEAFQVDERIWIGQLAVGSGFVVASTAFLIRSNLFYNSLDRDEIQGNEFAHVIKKWVTGGSVATTFLSIGAGTIVGSTIALLVQKQHRNRQNLPRIVPHVGASNAGITLWGQF